MSSISSRFSSMSSASGKSFQPPRPTFNSPKLVQESSLAPSPASETPKIAHPFATSSYGARRRAPTEPEPYREHHATLPRSSAQSYVPYASEFGIIGNEPGNAPSMQSSTFSIHFGSLAPHDEDSDPIGRRRSSTLGSQHVGISGFRPLPDDLLPSPNPMKSAFDDDSEDEEKLDASTRSVPHRARLAAIGTASRLFKGRRHSRTSSNSLAPSSSYQDLPPPLQLDKQSSTHLNSQLSRPSTSDGMSPAPRQAVFGHRPSPSELSFGSRSDKAPTVAPADRDLILGLKGGGAIKPLRPKVSDKRKLLPKTPEHHHGSRHHHTQSSGMAAASFADGKAHWMDPPPYCADDERLSRRESLRKSQSLSTLRFDISRRPRQPSPVSEIDEERASRPAHTDRSAWEAMLTESPSTVSDHSSISSCGRVIRTEIVSDSPPKRVPKAQRLPPQKPPPQFGLPLPPSLKESASVHSSSCSSKSPLEVDATPQTTLSPNVEAVQNVSSPSSKPSTPVESPDQHTHNPPSAVPKNAHPSSQVALDVGGTKFVTLVSTLQGAPSDHPRLIELLHCAEHESVLCNDTHLTRRKRVDLSNRSHERSDSDNSSQGFSSPLYTTVDEAQLSSKLNSALGAAFGDMTSQSSTSLSTTASVSMSSQTDSDTSTRRTSDMSDASSWSKSIPEEEAMPSDANHSVPKSADFLSTTLPSSRLCSPAYLHSPLLSSPTITHKPTTDNPASMFLDRNGELYRDILDILRIGKLPYRLKAASIQSGTNCAKGETCGFAALKVQLRCRLHEVSEEAEWLGYTSIVTLCEQEIVLV